jgi:hypothetical protein
MSLEPEAVDHLSLRPDVVLDLVSTPQMQGVACAMLTPAIWAKLREMEDG